MYNKKDDTFSLVWAKKIKAANLLGGKCEICGNDNIFCLEFHHLFPENKDITIGMIRNYRWSSIEDEVKKCQLLCRNCHAELRCDSNGKFHKRKKTLLENINKFKCENCGYSGKNYASLDFHHVGKKLFSISDGLNNNHRNKVSLQQLIDEISKCQVLCRNCHGIENINVDRFNRLKDIIMDKVENYKELQKALNRELVFDMYKNMKSLSKVAKELKCCKSTIAMIIRNGKIT